MSMTHKEMNEKYESWRKEQIAYLVRTGYPEAARAFRDLGSIHWAAWQSAWQASRESLVVELPNRFDEKYQDYYDDVEGGCFNEARYIKDVHAVIHAAGVKTK